MLALQVCGVAVMFLTTLPTQQWTDLTARAYGCPVRFVQAQQVTGLDEFLKQTPDGSRPTDQQADQKAGQDAGQQWRVLPASRLNDARPGDGLLLPGSPQELLWRPQLRRQLQQAHAQGIWLVLDTTDTTSTSALPALATAYSGLNLMPDAALLGELPAHLSDLMPGTYLLSDVGGLPLLPRVVRESQLQLVPYLPDASANSIPHTYKSMQGEWAGPNVSPGSTLHIRPSLSWTYAGASYHSGERLSGRAAWLARLLALGWTLGQVLNVPLPSLIYTASDTVAWVVLGMLVVTLLAVSLTLLGRRRLAPARINAPTLVDFVPPSRPSESRPSESRQPVPQPLEPSSHAPGEQP